MCLRIHDAASAANDNVTDGFVLPDRESCDVFIRGNIQSLRDMKRNPIIEDIVSASVFYSWLAFWLFLIPLPLYNFYTKTFYAVIVLTFAHVRILYCCLHYCFSSSFCHVLGGSHCSLTLHYPSHRCLLL